MRRRERKVVGKNESGIAQIKKLLWDQECPE